VRGHHARVLVVGSVNVDHTTYVARAPRPGETVLADGHRVGLGGKGANQAVAAARAGAEVHLLGCVGDDAAGTDAVAELAGKGVLVDRLRVHAERPTGYAAVTVGRDGENSIVVSPGANHGVDVATVRGDLHELLTDTRPTTVLLQGELRGDVVATTADVADGAGVPWIVNLAPYLHLATDLLRRAAVVVVNREELDQLAAGIGTPRSRDDLPTRARHVHEVLRGPALVVTLGSSGSLVVTDAVTPVTATLVDRVVDTTGAGDAFVGTLAAALAGGASLTDAVRSGTAAGAATVGRSGAQ
jgi:ribokinase